MNKILSRVWFPNPENYRAFKYASFSICGIYFTMLVILAVICIVISSLFSLPIIMELVWPFMIDFLLFFFVIRAIVSIRGALTLPLEELNKTMLYNGVEMRPLRKLRYVAACIPFLSLSSLFFLSDFFFIFFAALTVASISFFTYSGLSIRNLLIVFSTLALALLTIFAIQVGTWGIFLSLFLILIVVPYYFEEVIILNRTLNALCACEMLLQSN